MWCVSGYRFGMFPYLTFLVFPHHSLLSLHHSPRINIIMLRKISEDLRRKVWDKLKRIGMVFNRIGRCLIHGHIFPSSPLLSLNTSFVGGSVPAISILCIHWPHHFIGSVFRCLHCRSGL